MVRNTAGDNISCKCNINTAHCLLSPVERFLLGQFFLPFDFIKYFNSKFGGTVRHFLLLIYSGRHKTYSIFMDISLNVHVKL